MRIGFAILFGAVAVWAMGSDAQAFEQRQLAPTVPVTAPAQPQADISFDSKTTNAEPKKKGRGLKLPGVGKLSLPKMNFGLDLLYGSPQTEDTGLGFSNDPASDDDLTIRGTFKRRF